MFLAFFKSALFSVKFPSWDLALMMWQRFLFSYFLYKNPWTAAFSKKFSIVLTCLLPSKVSMFMISIQAVTDYFKVRTFWKGHKNLKQSPTWFDIYLVKFKSSERFCQIFVAFLENLNCMHMAIFPEDLYNQ